MGFFSKKKTSVLELLNEDLTKIDINTYEFNGTELNVAGSEFKKYQKKLKKKELDLFDSIEFILFQSGEKNFFLKGSIDKIEQSSLKKLVNDLVSFYGNDEDGCGKIGRNGHLLGSKSL